MAFYKAKLEKGKYERTPEIREKCHKTHLKNHNGLGLKRSEETKKEYQKLKNFIGLI